MADEQIITNIVARADLSSLVSEVHRATASLQNLQQQLSAAGKTVASQVKVINNSFGETLRSTGQFGSHFVTLHSDVEKFGKGLDAGRLKLRDFYSAFQQHAKTSGGLIRELAKQQVMLQNAVMQPIGRNAQGLMQYEVHIPRGLDLVKNKTKLANMELQIMNRAINEGATSLINWGKNTQWAGRQLTVGLTVPIAAFGAAAAKAFREADQELVRLTKVYGDVSGTTAKELGAVRSEIAKTSKELATTMGVNFKETISLAADIAATGKTGEELLGSLKETTRLAVLGEVDRQEAMKATLAIQSAFKQNTDQLSDSINFLNAVENQTSTTLNDLVEAIPKAGPVIKGLGGSVQDLALYLTAMREGGISASEGANALKSALASLINPTDVAVDKFKGFGIDILSIVNNNAGNVTQTLFALQAALDKLDPLQKQQAIEQLFGKFQFSRLNALFENLGKQGSQTLQVLDLMKASAGDLEALATRELTAVTESASGRYRRAIEGLRAEMSVLGEDFLDIGTKFINVITKLMKFLNNLPEPVKKLVTAFAGLTAVAGPIIMLTGVLANFAGYILKGATNLKALLSGSRGWKMLTPEIVAAEHAARTLGDTFYTDAQAAAILEQALRNLVDEFNVLQTAVNNGNISVQPAIRTLAGGTIMPGGTGRVVDAAHPLVGERDTRAFSHINPRKSGYASGGIFGVVPGAIPVNQKIGAVPQIYMSERLPNIEGLTSVGGVSTGIVSDEAAKFHALMATLSMRTEAEVEALKKTISLGGTINSDLLNTYDDLLPITQKFATKAANESAAIVAELRAAKITVDQAKARILALNAQIDAEMTAELAQFAALRGLPFDPMKAPLIDQSATDPTGKYNLRDMFKRESSRGVLEEFGRLRGIRTFGAPYSIEVTKLPKFNDGDWVPGPNVNADVVPAMLTPGEFVVRRDIAQSDPEGMTALNEGRAEIVPFQANKGGQVPGVQYLFGGGPARALADMLIRRTAIGGSRAVGVSSRGHARTSGYNLLNTPGGLSNGFGYANYAGAAFWGSRAGREMSRLYGVRGPATVRGSRAQSEVNIHAISSQFTGSYGRGAGRASTPDIKGSDLIALGASGNIDPSRAYRILPAMSLRGSKEFNEMLPLGQANASMWQKINGSNLTDLAFYLHHTLKLPPNVVKNILEATANRINYAVMKNPNRTFSENDFGDIVFNSIDGSIRSHMSGKTGNWVGLNRGGMVPGYNRGGRVRRYGRGGGVVRSGRLNYGENYRVTDKRAVQSTMGISGTPIYGTPIAQAGPTGNVPRATLVDRLRLSGYMPGGNSVPLNIQNNQIVPGPAPKTMGMGKMLGYGMLGGTAGSMLGSSFGQMGMILGGTVGSFLPQIIMSLKTASQVAGGLFKVLKSLTIPGLVLTTIGLIVKGLLNWKKSAEEAGKANRLAFGGTEDSFASVGIKQYKEMSDRIKDINEKLELHKAKVKSAYESYTRTGTPGLTLTIKELRDAIKNAKENQEEYVNAFNNIDSSRVVGYAAQLKAQFVAMGMSAQEATNQIYAIVKASEKAGQALAAITSKDFTSISDSISGISFLIKVLKKELESEDFNAEEFNAGLDTLLNSIIIYKDALVGTTDENKKLLDQADALQITMEKISKMKGAQKELSEENLEALKNENLIYAGILGKAETLESITAKIMLYQSGFAEVVDLADMGAEAAVAFAKNLAIVQNVMNSITEDTNPGSKNPLLPLANIIARVKNEATTAAEQVKKLKKVDEDYYKNKIDAIQKTIKALQEERAARLKALDVQEQAQSYEISLSQAQIRYSQAVATGDLALAAQEQLSIEKLIADRQRQLTRDKINDTYDAKIDKLEKRIEDLQNELKDAQNSYNAKTAAATQKAADLAALENYRDRLEEIALRNYGKPVMSKSDAQEISVIFEEMLAAGGELAQAATEMRKAYGLGSGVYQMGWQQALVNALNNQVAGNKEFKTAVDEFAAAVREFADKGEGTLDVSKIVSFSGNQGQVNVKYLYDADINPVVGNRFKGSDGKEYEIVEVKNNSAKVKKREAGGRFAAGERLLVGERGPEVVEFNRGGEVRPNAKTAPMPTLGTPDPNQSFLNKFLFGTKYIGGDMKMLKGEVPFGTGNIGKLVAETIKNGAKWSAEARAFQMAAIDKEAVENLFKMDLSKISLPDRLPSVNVGTARNAISDRLSGSVKGGLESFNANDWEIVQALRVMELSKKFPKLDLSDTKIFNELYAKEFYGLTGNPMMQLFKGVRNLDPSAAVSKGWRTAGGLPTYFSTNPYIAAMYSLMLGRRTPENLPMFAMNLPLSKLPGFLGEGSIRPGNAQGSMEFPQAIPAKLLSEFASTIKQYDLPGSIMGNWFKVGKDGGLGIKDLWPRLHDWNDKVPGPYGKEVGAVLKAGTEGVYQTSYINSLKNGTMNEGLVGSSPTVINIENTYNIPENMSKEDIGRYIIDLQRKDLARLGLPRNNNH